MDDLLTEEEKRAAIADMENDLEQFQSEEYLNYEKIESETEEEQKAKDADYHPSGRQSGKQSAKRAARSKSKAKKSDENEPKRKVLKKEAELPIKIDLINLVKNERSLYNLKDPLYMSRIHKEKIWSEICDEMKKKYPEMTIETCKKMWNAVRESTRWVQQTKTISYVMKKLLSFEHIYTDLIWNLFVIFSQFVDSQKTSRFKEKSGAPLEYGDDIELSVDIYKDSWPLAQYMTWFIPASVRDANSVSIGDGGSHSQQLTTTQFGPVEEIMELPVYTEDEDNMILSQESSRSVRSKPRGKNDGFESTFANVAASLTEFIHKQSEQKEVKSSPHNTLKYAQMYEELDKALEGAPFLAAVKFLTTTIENANTQFKQMTD